MNETLTRSKKDWNKFADLLASKEGIDVKIINNKFTSNCDNKHTKAKKILRKYFPKYDIPMTIKYFEKNGGYCDCEVLMNVDK